MQIHICISFFRKVSIRLVSIECTAQLIYKQTNALLICCFYISQNVYYKDFLELCNSFSKQWLHLPHCKCLHLDDNCNTNKSCRAVAGIQLLVAGVQLQHRNICKITIDCFLDFECRQTSAFFTDKTFAVQTARPLCQQFILFKLQFTVASVQLKIMLHKNDRV